VSSIARRVVVSGRVTGVGFRYATLCEARKHPSLTGYVRNVDYGTVECVVQGDAVEVEALVTWLQRGPPGARVLRHEVTAVPCWSAKQEFYISG
jgi:acylphosphatase